MSIWSSLYTASSGLAAHGDAIGVVGDNIANASTNGFQSSRSSFNDILGRTGHSGTRVGSGVRMGGTATSFGQGATVQTGAPLDMAIRGNGMFVLRGSHGGVDGSYYTRNGNFHLDANGEVVNGAGLKLQGYAINASGQPSTAVGNIQLGGQSPPSATTAATMAVNLSSNSPMPALPWNPLDPGNTSSYATSTTVYDSLGNSHVVDMYFVNNGNGQWDWHAMVDGGELAGGTPGTPTEIASGSLGFNTSGQLDTETPGASTANFLGAQPGQAITFDFGDAITTDGGTGVSGSTQYAAGSSVSALSQDGYAAGEIVDVSISETGELTAIYSNGQRREVAQVAVASFRNLQGLAGAGSQLYAATPDSGEALVGTAGEGGRGSISGGALEGSNVDIGAELVTLIQYQRAFQANARTVSTADEMMAEVNNLKR